MGELRQINLLRGDNRENKSKGPVFEAFPGIKYKDLDAGDYISTCPKNMIEIKIEDDANGLGRMGAELTKMNFAIYDSWVKHAILVRRNPNFQEYRRFVSMCVRANVFPHWVKDIPDMIELMRQIFKGKYNEPIYIVEHTKKLTPLAEIFEVIKGVSAEKAQELADECKEDFAEFMLIPKSILLRVFGTNKDGSQPAIAKKILRRFGLL